MDRSKTFLLEMLEAKSSVRLLHTHEQIKKNSLIMTQKLVIKLCFTIY